MKTAIARVLPVLIGLLTTLTGIQFLAAPAAATASLGMPLLDGIGRSTQVGDMMAFFFSFSAMCFLGAWRIQAIWLQGAAMLMSAAAIGRTLTTLLHDAPFATQFIAVEVVSAVILLVCARHLATVQKESATVVH